MVARILELIKRWGSEYRNDFLLGSAVFLVAMISFGLGRLSVIWDRAHPPVVIQSPEIRDTKGAETAAGGEAAPDPVFPKEGLVASKSGSRYYPADCPAAKRIKPENLISFKTAALAEAAGYRPAANCPGF